VNDVFGQVAQNVAFTPLRSAIQSGVADQVRLAAADLPGGGRKDGRILVSFDYLNPRVIDAVRSLDTKVITTLQGDTREAVRAFTENGLRDGVNPREIARQIRGIVGLSPTQESYVRNLRDELVSGRYADASQRKLLDARFNLSNLDKLSAADRGRRIDTIVESYRKSYVAFNAETNARTAALDSTKLGQRLSWEDAATKGIVDRNRLEKTWRGVKDDRERDEHLAMEGETVGFDEPFSNGEDDARRVDLQLSVRADRSSGHRQCRRGSVGWRRLSPADSSAFGTAAGTARVTRATARDGSARRRERDSCAATGTSLCLGRQRQTDLLEARQRRGGVVHCSGSRAVAQRALNDSQPSERKPVLAGRSGTSARCRRHPESYARSGFEPETGRAVDYRMTRVPGPPSRAFRAALSQTYDNTTIVREVQARLPKPFQQMTPAEIEKIWWEVMHERLTVLIARFPQYTYERSYP
jgi:hypothetical protein